jgi:shikimate dehydrogenase
MNNAFKRCGLDNVLVALRCDVDHFPLVMDALRAMDIGGYVITMPFKELVAAHIDELRDEARISGSVNCIENDNGRLIGYNTDCKGFWDAILEKNRGDGEIPIRKLFLFGMGGVARAVTTKAALQGEGDCRVNREEKYPASKATKPLSKRSGKRFWT